MGALDKAHAEAIAEYVRDRLHNMAPHVVLEAVARGFFLRGRDAESREPVGEVDELQPSAGYDEIANDLVAIRIPPVLCPHRWNENDYCDICGADGRA